MSTADQQAWDALTHLDPVDVCARAPCAFDPSSRAYTLESFGQNISVSLPGRSLSSDSPLGAFILSEFGRDAVLIYPGYLVAARNTPLSGRLVRPGVLSGGDIYDRGTHMLPLDRLARSYERDPDGFLRRARMFGAAPISYGDAAARFFPLPRLPVVIILQAASDEFPAQADLFLDSTATDQLPFDILWSTATLTVRLMFCSIPPPA